MCRDVDYAEISAQLFYFYLNYFAAILVQYLRDLSIEVLSKSEKKMNKLLTFNCHKKIKNKLTLISILESF